MCLDQSATRSVLSDTLGRKPCSFRIRTQRGALRLTNKRSSSTVGSMYGLSSRRTARAVRSNLCAVASIAFLYPRGAVSDL